MKVSFTPKEFGRLLELAHLGLAVAGSRIEDPSTMPARYAGIAEKVFGLAEAMGCADLVEQDINGQTYPGEKLTTGPAQEKLDEFCEEVFWTELVERLSERDLKAETGIQQFTLEQIQEHQERLEALEQTYWQEFETQGVDHLYVIRGGKG